MRCLCPHKLFLVHVHVHTCITIWIKLTSLGYWICSSIMFIEPIGTAILRTLISETTPENQHTYKFYVLVKVGISICLPCVLNVHHAAWQIYKLCKSDKCTVNNRKDVQADQTHKYFKLSPQHETKVLGGNFIIHLSLHEFG